MEVKTYSRLLPAIDANLQVATGAEWIGTKATHAKSGTNERKDGPGKTSYQENGWKARQNAVRLVDGIAQ